MKSIVLLMALSLTAGVFAEVEIPETCTEDADCAAGESCICIDDGILDFNSATSTRSSMSTGAIVGGTVAMMLNDQTSVSSIAFGAVCGAAMAGVSGADAAQTCGCVADDVIEQYNTTAAPASTAESERVPTASPTASPTSEPTPEPTPSPEPSTSTTTTTPEPAE